MKIGPYAKRLFTTLLEKNLLNDSQIKKLQDNNYCYSEFGVLLPVLLDLTINPIYDEDRY